jgi:hypothetical protein
MEESQLKEIKEIISQTNIEIIKCYKLVFSLKGKLFNIGFWIFLILVILHLPLLFLYFYHGIKPIKTYIFEEMEKFGYINVKNEEVIHNKNKDKDNKENKNKNKHKHKKKTSNKKLNGPPKKKKKFKKKNKK